MSISGKLDSSVKQKKNNSEVNEIHSGATKDGSSESCLCWWQQQCWGRNPPCSITQRVLTEYLLRGVWNILESASYPSPKEPRFGDFPGMLQRTSICQISGERENMPLFIHPMKGVDEMLGSWCLVILPVLRHLGRHFNIWKLNRNYIKTWLGKLGNREFYLQFGSRNNSLHFGKKELFIKGLSRSAFSLCFSCLPHPPRLLTEW